jgi:gamma-glutamyltranspeptidase/glutathione hydrolase
MHEMRVQRTVELAAAALGENRPTVSLAAAALRADRPTVSLAAAALRADRPTVIGLLVAALLALAPVTSANGTTGRSAAATEHPLSTRHALAQLRAGGNAIDAAVTAALVAGVVNPSSSGIGGGGFALVWLGKEQKPFLLDFRETAPIGIDSKAFDARPFATRERGRMVGVPGEVSGLFELHRRFGRRPWPKVVAPATALAKGGFAVGAHLGAVLAQTAATLRDDAGIAGVFFPGGRPAVVGRVLKNPKLGATLGRIAAEGPKALYEGSIARDIVESSQRVGGALAQSDLLAYAPVERTPVRVSWEGYDVYTMPPPSAGGMMLAQTLRLFRKAELKKLATRPDAYQHLLAEAMRGAIADRYRYLGDPSFVRIDLERLISRQRMAARKRHFGPELTHAIGRFVTREQGTHHLVTADADANIVSLTTTVNRAFGAKLSGESSGIVLNDELDDFTSVSDIADLGLSRSPNIARPGARPVSSMTPTIVVEKGRAILALGGSGGMAIATNVTQALLASLALHEPPQRAVTAKRFGIPTQGAFISLEPGAPEELVQALERRGEIVRTNSPSISAVQLIAIDAQGNKRPAADPRKHGSAAAE